MELDQKLDKDEIFTSKWNSKRVFKMIYSTKFDSSSNSNAVLRSTHDPTNSSNAAPRSTYDLRQTATQCSWNQHTIPRRTWDALIPIIARKGQQLMRNSKQKEIDAAEKYPKNKNKETKGESQTQDLTRFDNLPMSSGQGRERFYWFNNQLQVVPLGFQRDTIHEGSNPYL